MWNDKNAMLVSQLYRADRSSFNYFKSFTSLAMDDLLFFFKKIEKININMLYVFFWPGERSAKGLYSSLRSSLASPSSPFRFFATPWSSAFLSSLEVMLQDKQDKCN